MIVFFLLLVAGFLFYFFTGNIVLMTGVILVGILIIFWGGQIQLVSSYHEVEQAEGNIEDGFQKRHDLLIKVVDTVKSDFKKRDEHLDKLLKIAEEKRSRPRGFLGQTTQGEYEKWYQQTRQELIDFMSSQDELNQQSHQMLIRSINEVEENLSAARRFYNHASKKYNTSLNSFPGNLIGRMKGFKPLPYFKVVDEGVREDVKILL